MSDIRTLVRHSTQYFGGRLGLMVLGFVSFPLFTRLFSVADYGLINLAMKVVLTVTVLSKMGIQHSVLRFYEEDKLRPDGNALRRYYSTFFFGTALTAAVVTLIFVLCLCILPKSMVSDQLRDLLIFVSILIFIRGLQSVLGGFFRAEGRPNAFNALELGTKAAGIIVICLLLFTWQRSVWSFLTGTVSVEIAAVLVITLLLFRRRVLNLARFNYTFFSSALSFGAPLIGFELANMVLDSGDRLLVQYYLGSQALGYYSAAYNIAGYLQDLLMAPLNMALVPLCVKLWSSKGKEPTQALLSRSLDYFVMGSIGILCIVVLTSSEALTILASNKYHEAHGLLPTLVLGILLFTLTPFIYAGLILYKKTLLLTKLAVSASIVNVLLNIALLPRMGLQGAAVATAASYGFLVIITARKSQALLPLRFEFAAACRYLIAGAVGLIIASYVQGGNALALCVEKGGLFVVVYGGVLWLIDGRVRRYGAIVTQACRRRVSKVLLQPRSVSGI